MNTILNFSIEYVSSRFLSRQTIGYILCMVAFGFAGSSTIHAQTTQVVLNGVTISTGLSLNWSQSVLIVSASSTIALGPINHTVTFAASDEVAWTGTTLTVTGWTGTAGSSGTAGKIFIGIDSSGLTPDQLSKVDFTGYEGTAMMLSTGEIVPAGVGSTSAVISNVMGSSDICEGGIANLSVAIIGGTSPYTLVYSDGSSNFTVNNYVSGANIPVTPSMNTTYTIVSVTDNANNPGGNNSGSAEITVTSSMVPASIGTFSSTLNHTDGATLTYVDASCNLISRIGDAAGGNVLASTTAMTTLLSTPPLPQMANSQTFGPRYHTITPTSGGSSTVTFYYLQSDFTTYNAANGTLDMPTSGNNQDPNIVNIKIAQINTGGPLSTTTNFTPSMVNYNATASYWEVTVQNVNVTSGGSEFYFYGEANCNLTMNAGSILFSNITSTSAMVSWDPVIGATGYVVRWRTGAGVWLSASRTLTSINLTSLNSGSSYEVQVRVICNNGFGLNSTSVSFNTLTIQSICEVPTGLAATGITTKGAVIGWNAVTNNAVSYTLRWRTTSPVGGWNQATTTMTSRNLNPFLEAGTTYDLQVRTNCSGAQTNLSDWSAIVQFTTNASLPVCAVPTGLAATNITRNGAVIGWNAVANNAVSYSVRWRVSPAGGWNQATTDLTSRNLSPWLLAGTTYDVQIRTNCSGTQSAQSEWSPIVQFTTVSPLEVCVVPTGLAATEIATNGAFVVWDSMANNAASYTIRWRVSPAGGWNQATTNLASRNLKPWLLSATNYDLQVRSNCSGAQTAQSNWSSIVQFTTDTIPCSLPPTNIVVNNVTSNSANVSWNTVSNYGSFRVRYKLINSSTWDSLSTTNLNILLSGLVSGSAYEVQVKTICNNTYPGVSSGWSNSITFTTAAALLPNSTTVESRNQMKTSDNISISIFPNPTSDVLNLTFDSQQGSLLKIRFIDVTGKVINEVNHTTTEGHNLMNVSLDHLENGAYMLQVFAPDRLIYMGRVMKIQ